MKIKFSLENSLTFPFFQTFRIKILSKVCVFFVILFFLGGGLETQASYILDYELKNYRNQQTKFVSPENLCLPDEILKYTADSNQDGSGDDPGWICAPENTASSVTLDEAYDSGGPGAGREINVDSGAVKLTGTGEVLELGDGSASDIALVFNDGVTRFLKWMASAQQFFLNAATFIAGDLGVEGEVSIAESHISTSSEGRINLGREGDVWQTFAYDSLTDNRFEMSAPLSIGGTLTAMELDLQGGELLSSRLENKNGSVEVPACSAAQDLGRQYYDQDDGNAYVCIEADPVASPGNYSWFDLTSTFTTTSTKVVTVGTGGNYSSLANAAGYLNPLTGGIILLTAENHTVNTPVDLENITLIGANTDDTVIQITGGGSLSVKETQFKSLTMNVDAGMIGDAGLNAKYDPSTTSSLIFEWVDFQIEGTKYLLDSTYATAPTVRTRFISTSATSGNQQIIKPLASANLSPLSTHFVESQRRNGGLNFADWDVTISGSGNAVTTGKITTIPENTIYVYPGMNIQGAIDSVPGGGVITLLPGIHTISDPLRIENDSLEITGYGDSSIVRAIGFAAVGETDAAIQIGGAEGTDPAKDIVLRNFKLEVGNSNIHGIRAAGGEDVQLYNLTVQKIAGTSGSGSSARIGVQFLDGTATPLTRPVVKNCRILGDDTTGSYFTDGIHITGGESYGFAGIWTNGSGVRGVKNALIEGNNVDYVRETVAVFVGVEDSSLFNNRFSRMGAGGAESFGLFMGNSLRANMNANVVSHSLSPSSHGFVIETLSSGSLKQVQDSIFSNNTVDGTADGGVGFQNAFYIGGTTATTEVNRNIFQGNVVRGASVGTDRRAFYLRQRIDENIFTSNILVGGINEWDIGFDVSSDTNDRNIVTQNQFENVTLPINDVGTATLLKVTHHRSLSDPTVNDDQGDGFFVGTIWINTATDESFILTDSTPGTANWAPLGGEAGTGGGDFSQGGEAGGMDRTLGNTDLYDLGFLTDNQSRLHIESTGSVGIGTTTPYSNKYLTLGDGGQSPIAGAQGLYIDSPSGGGIFMGEADETAQGKYEIWGGKMGVGTITNHPLEFWTQNNIRMHISPTGQVGIGTTTIDGDLALDIEGKVGASQYCNEDGTQCALLSDLVNTSISQVSGNLTGTDLTFTVTEDGTDYTSSAIDLSSLQDGYEPDTTIADGLTCTEGQILQWSSALGAWQCATSGGGTGTTLADLSVVQARRSTDFSLPNADTWYDLPLDITDIENNAAVLEHNALSPERIDIKTSGVYRITYHLRANDASATHTINTRVQSNGTTTLEGSILGETNYPGEHGSISGNFVASLGAGDFITLQAERTTSNTVVGETLLTVTKLEGIPGPAGADGAPGGTTVDIQQNDTLVASEIETINFEGSATVVDEGNKKVTINVTGGGTPISSIFDAYDATGNETLTESFTNLNIDTPRISDGAYSLSADTVTIQQSGLYKVLARITTRNLDTSGAQRTSIVLKAQADTGAGFVDIPGTLCQDYIREENSTDETSASCTLIFTQNFNAGDQLRLQKRTTTNTTTQTLPEGSSLFIEFIR